MRKSRQLLFSLCALVSVAAAADRKAPSAELKVSGLGWQENRLAGETLKVLLGDKPRPTLDANVIEDAALILFSQVTDEGFLKAKITAELTLADGTKVSFPLDARLDHPLPRPLAATAATLQVHEGLRYVLEAVTFAGLKALPEERARSFFVGESLLIAVDADQIYAPGRLERSVANLQVELQQHGYEEAVVRIDRLQVDETTGKARTHIVVTEGPLWRVQEVQLATSGGGEPPAELTSLMAKRTGEFWSAHWRQDTLTSVRRWYYERGYPDAQVRITAAPAPPLDGERRVTAKVEVTPGPLVHVGRIAFRGNTHTRESAMKGLVPARTGDLLDPAKFDDGLSRLSRLGVFSHIALGYEDRGDDVRDVTYHLTEGRRQELNLLAGYGSYEQLRGGIEWRHYNLFGLAHSDNLQLIQSMKSTQASYTYTVPELFGTTVDGSARLFGLRRQELAFDREEYGGNVSLLWPLRGIGASLTTGYTYQNLLNNDNQLATQSTDPTQTIAASLDLGFIKDKRDNPLQPHHGYKVALQVEAAAKALGGEVDYQQILFTSSWHTPWGHGRWFHVGLAHGVVTTLGAPEGSLPPVNVLFYPGGEGSIRGYQKDEAAPRDPVTGDFVGAKTYTQLNVELEQALTRKWTVVAFVDAVGTATRLEDYPFSEELYSAGLGVRYNTVIGPIRLEYGHNLNPRPLDPQGTLLFSIGYPF